MSYSTDRRRWSDQFIPEITRHIAPHLIVPTSFDVDTQQAADLIVLTARDMRIAARIRRHSFVKSFGNQFTIRAKSNGNKTEMQKITDGWGDWMFYGFASADESTIDRWFLISLDAFRAALIRDKGGIVKGMKWNDDRATALAWFDIRSFPSDILVASSHDISFSSRAA